MGHDAIIEEIARRAIAASELVHCCRPAQGYAGVAGFPDLVIVGNRGLMFAGIRTAHSGAHAVSGRGLWARRLHAVDSLCDSACERAGVLHKVFGEADLDDGGQVDLHLAAIA